jgi:hypothetical protein
MEKQVEVDQYWRGKEEELGEPILMKSISHTYYRGIPDTFGILYSSEHFLIYEYSKKGRKSILETLFSRRGGEELTESVRIPREQIREAALVNSSAARSWIRRSLDPAQVLRNLQGARPNPILNALTGTVVCVCTDSDYIVLDTPSNRPWVTHLKERNQ